MRSNGQDMRLELSDSSKLSGFSVGLLLEASDKFSSDLITLASKLFEIL